MKTQDLFTFNRSAARINESIEKTFGQRLNLESFDLQKLEDARNKLRTQIHDARSQSGFNENIENEAMTKAQWMLDAIVAEIMDREEHIVDTTMQEGEDDEVAAVLGRIADEEDFDQLYDLMGDTGPVGKYLQDQIQDITAETGLDPKDDFQRIESIIMDRIQQEFGGQNDDEGGETDDNYALASAGFGSDEDYESIETEGERDPEDWDEGNTEPPNNFAVSINGKQWKVFKGRGQYADDSAERKHYYQLKDWAAKKSESTGKKWEVSVTGAPATESVETVATEAYVNNAKDAINLLADIRKQSKMAELGQGDPVRPNQLVNDLYDVMQWIEANMKESVNTESVNTGDIMTRLQEGEVQQASAIVTAKTMVDRVSRWIEELSGMENDTLLQLGDSIRDEMSQEQAKTFISSVAPAIQQALENLKTTRETLATGVRMLTGEEQGAEMLGGEPSADMGGDEMGAVEPDAMNAGGEELGGDDEFAAAEPAAGMGDAGREQRESIDRSSSLLKVLAG